MACGPSRRRFLRLSGAAVTVSLSGCAGFRSVRSTDSPFPSIELNEDSVSTAEAEYDATLCDSFSESSPAKVEISFRNKTDRAREFTFSAAPPFSGLLGRPAENPRDGLVLIPENSAGHADFYRTKEPHERYDDPTDAIPDEPIDTCWEALGLLDHEPVQTVRTIEAGDALTNTYHILESAKGTDCYQATRYYFESNSHFDSKSRWGFELILE
jgi:hypothetical protein